MNNLRILVVDDYPSALSGLRRYMKAVFPGAVIDTAESAEALGRVVN